MFFSHPKAKAIRLWHLGASRAQPWELQYMTLSDSKLKPQDLLKVTVHLQGCLAGKRCSECSLSGRYLNPYMYIKLKLIELAIKLYKEFWNKMNCCIFHGHWMRAPESPFESYKSKRILFFGNLIFSLVSGPKALKNVSAFFHIQLQWKVTEHFRNRIKKMQGERTKIALEEKIFQNTFL